MRGPSLPYTMGSCKRVRILESIFSLMGNQDFSEEAIEAARKLYSDSLHLARENANKGKFLTLQEQLREMERRAKGLHYSEKLQELDEKIASLNERLERKVS